MNNERLWVTNIDQYDTNNDGIAAIDLDFGTIDFSITNTNWVIQGDGSTTAIFRILGDSNLVLNQSTIVIGNGGIGGVVTGSPIDGVGAIFVKSTGFSNGLGGFNAGESANSSDTVFSFNNTVLNRVAFWDLQVFGKTNNNATTGTAIGNANFDNGTTVLNVQNGQGCAQFVSGQVLMSNGRREWCADGTDDSAQYTNIATVTGKPDYSSGTSLGLPDVSDSDSATFNVMPSYELGTKLGKPLAITLEYTPGTVANESLQPTSDQGARIVTGVGTGLIDDDRASYIRISDKSGATDVSGKEYFEGNVAFGEVFQASITNPGASGATSIGPVMSAHIFDDAGGTLLQTLQYTTNGMQPMFFGDQVGGFTVVGYHGANAGAVTPIVIDLDNDGIETVALADSAGAFDLLGNGKPIQSGWLSGDDGFLVIDSNGNGVIDTISELFGGLDKGDGFAKLASFDSNSDGLVDAGDNDFASLKIWQDANGNHQTDAGELMSLSDAGVASLNVNFAELPFIDSQGNLHLEHSSATLADGHAVDMTDVYFNVSAEDAAAAGVTVPDLVDLATMVNTDPLWLV